MTTLTINFEDEKVSVLTERAKSTGIEVEELIRRSVDDYLNRSEKVASAMEYVLNKNAELYRRLA